MAMEKGSGDMWVSYEAKRAILEKSEVLRSILESVENLKITNIRCLGLGLFGDSASAMYQLALLTLLELHFQSGSPQIEVTLWDPAFTAVEVEFLTTNFNYTVVESVELEAQSTLFYMPHFPIAALENVLTKHHPLHVLSNDLTVYNTKFTDAKYFEQYPNCARLANLTNRSKLPEDNAGPKDTDTDGFQMVTKKKNRRKKNSAVHVPTVVDYEFDAAYFKEVSTSQITAGNNTDNPWDSAFTDTVLMVLTLR